MYFHSLIFKVGEINFNFICQSVGNRSGFKHETELHSNGGYYGTAKCQYYNRTWECYSFQSVILKLTDNLLENEKSYLKDRFKKENNIQKITKKRTAAFEDFCNCSERFQTLTELENKIRSGEYTSN